MGGEQDLLKLLFLLGPGNTKIAVIARLTKIWTKKKLLIANTGYWGEQDVKTFFDLWIGNTIIAVVFLIFYGFYWNLLYNLQVVFITIL